MADDINFAGQILDNVHGFIPYTAAEEQIIESLYFKRLQSIKQLSVVNWVFPGSEHTRFIHSLGVMHIADKIAVSLDLTPRERKIVRLAGLLHDIGHYPLSHVCEAPYKKPIFLEDLDDSKLCEKVNERVIGDIESFSVNGKTTLMTKSDGRHHEAIGALIVKNNQDIKEVIIKECEDEHAPEIIADIITGNVERKETDSLLVQIIHSEFDADGIDYLMRDATFSGTSFGSFEIDQLIRCLTVGQFEGKRILCIEPKGIAAADQYLINKFFSYSQVVFNKHIVVSEWMAGYVVDWMQKHHAVFPDGITLEQWAKSCGESESDEYLNFTDNMFWAALSKILSDDLLDLVPHHIRIFCTYLLRHMEPDFISEIRIVTTDAEEAKAALKETEIVKNEGLRNQRITIMSKKRMTSQMPIEEFHNALKRTHENHEEATPDEGTYLPSPEASRLMECLSIKEKDGSIHLLCDDKRSLMRQMYSSTLVVLREYQFPQNNE